MKQTVSHGLPERGRCKCCLAVLRRVSTRDSAIRTRAKDVIHRNMARIAAAASFAWASSAVTVTSILAFESVNCLAMSLAVNNALMVVAVAPARRMPWKATANAELFGDKQADDVADADAAVRKRTGERVDAADHLAVAGLPAGLRVDRATRSRVGVVDVGEQEVVDARRRDFDFGKRTRETHGATPIRTSSSCLISFFGATNRNDASTSSRTSLQSTFLRAAKSRPSQPNGPM